MKKYQVFILGLALGIGLMLCVKDRGGRVITQTKIIDNPIPIYDTIFIKDTFYIKQEVNDSILNLYTEAKKINDSLALEVVKNLATKRKYEEKLEDKNITISVGSNTTGFLDNQIISYKLKKVEARGFYYGGYVILNSNSSMVGVDLHYLNSNKLYTFGVGLDKSILIGINFRF